eukprot:COSAG04_NODE_31_length_35649_cov_21.693052_25_plen_195_part_00
MALSAEDVAHFREFGYVVVRAAYQPSRIAELRAAAERFLARDPAGVAWVTPEGAQRVLGGQKLNHLLLPDKFEPVYAEWLAEDALPHLEALIEGGQVRHSLFNMFVCGDLASVGEDWEQLSHGRTVQLCAALCPLPHSLPSPPRPVPLFVPSHGDMLRGAAQGTAMYTPTRARCTTSSRSGSGCGTPCTGALSR